MPIIQATSENLVPLALLFDAYRVFYRKESDVDAAFQFLKERIANEESIIFIAIDEDKSIKGFVQLYPLFSSTRMKKL